MKRNYQLLLGTIFFGFSALCQVPTHKNETIAVAAKKPVHAVEIPSTFAKDNVQAKSIEEALANKEVKRIELYYTRYKESESFDQQALNEKRVLELLEKYPELKSQKIEWVWREQTEAITRETAAQCFHGFRVYGIDKPQTVAKSDKKYSIEQFKVEDKGNLPTKFTVTDSKGGDFTSPSGSVIHVPANAVVDKNGKLVTGNYTLEFTEYRNAAEIAYSGLPMNFSENGTDYVFNSAGMYKLEGKQNKQDLMLKNPIKVDFNCTDQLKNLNFYQLNSESGEWKELRKINFQQDQVKEINNPKIKNKKPVAHENNSSIMSISWYYKDNGSELTLTKSAWEAYLELKKEKPDLIKELVESEIPLDNKLISKDKDPNKLINEIFGAQKIEFPFNMN